jgi:hypothetical protein
MSYRFTETGKWEDPWFRKLKKDEKLVFLYLLDKCNSAGFLELDYEIISFFTGVEIRGIEGAMKGLNRGLIEADGWVWIKNFLRHQKNLPLNDKNNAHKPIICQINEQLSRFDNNKDMVEILGAYKGLISPIGKGKGKGNKGGVGENDPYILIGTESITDFYDFLKQNFGIQLDNLVKLKFDVVAEAKMFVKQKAQEQFENNRHAINAFKHFLKQPKKHGEGVTPDDPTVMKGSILDDVGIK